MPSAVNTRPVVPLAVSPSDPRRQQETFTPLSGIPGFNSDIPPALSRWVNAETRQQAVDDYWADYDAFRKERLQKQEEWDRVEEEKKEKKKREAEEAKRKEQEKKAAKDKGKGKRVAEEEPEAGPSNKKVKTSKSNGKPVEYPCKECVTAGAECRKGRAVACFRCLEKHHKCSLTDRDGVLGPAIDRLALVSAWSSFGVQRATLALANVQLVQAQLEFYRLSHNTRDYAIPDSLTNAMEVAQDRVYDAVAGANAELDAGLERFGEPVDEEEMESWWVEAPIRAPVRGWVTRGGNLRRRDQEQRVHQEVQTEVDQVERESVVGSPEQEAEDVEEAEAEEKEEEKEKEKEKEKDGEDVQEAETIM